jgi:mitogen-activated protein kinase kinase
MALCRQYGIGFDADLEEASEAYSLIDRENRAVLDGDSFRCLRSLNKAKFSTIQFPDFFSERIRSRESHAKISSFEKSPALPVSPTSRSFNPPRQLSDYMEEACRFHAIRWLGTGGASQVRLVQDPVTGKSFAVKYLSMTGFDGHTFIGEVEALAKLNHPCILRIVGWTPPEPSVCPQIRTEYAANGSLEDVLCKSKTNTLLPGWTATRKGILICDIVLGMRYVHSKQIIHRDLKPSNILITAGWRALISDFGSSRFEPEDFTAESGTVHYAAPELFQDGIACTTKADLWSFGLILFELFTGRAVFPISMTPFEVIATHRSTIMPDTPAGHGEFLCNLIRRCWSTDPSSRR